MATKTTHSVSTTKTLTYLVLALGFGVGVISLIASSALRDLALTSSVSRFDPNAVYPEPDVSRPNYLTAITDGTFGTKLTRITGDTGTAIPGVSGTWAADSRHHYSKDQPWSSDGSLIALEQKSGTPSKLYLDGNTYQPVTINCSTYTPSDDRWHPSPSYPKVRINVKNDKLQWYDLGTCTKLREWQLPYYVKYMGDGEGNPSNDGRYVVLGQNGLDQLLVDHNDMFLVDMDPQAELQIGPVYDLNGVEDCGLAVCPKWDWISVSSSGKYVVVSTDDHLRVFEINHSTLVLTPYTLPATAPECIGDDRDGGSIVGLGHADLAINPYDLSSDKDVIIGQRRSFCSNLSGYSSLGKVVMVKLENGAVTPLTVPTALDNEAYSHHISTRNLDRPGWAYVGYFLEDGKRFSDEIMAVKMDGSLQVERFIHKHSVFSGATCGTVCYRAESHAVPSRDGQRVLFASNWATRCSGGCGLETDIKAYIVDARQASTGGGGGKKRTRIFY